MTAENVLKYFVSDSVKKKQINPNMHYIQYSLFTIV